MRLCNDRKFLVVNCIVSLYRPVHPQQIFNAIHKNSQSLTSKEPIIIQRYLQQILQYFTQVNLKTGGMLCLIVLMILCPFKIYHFRYFSSRFPKSKGVAGHVASTGETLNIVNAYDDPRFNRFVRVHDPDSIVLFDYTIEIQLVNRPLNL